MKICLTAVFLCLVRTASADEAERPPAEVDPAGGRLVVGVSALGGASDEADTTATRFGGFGAELGWHLRPKLAVLASLRETFASQGYLGVAAGEVISSERRTDAEAVVDWRIGRRPDAILSPALFLGGRFLSARSEASAMSMAGPLVGGRLEASLHPQLVAEASCGWAYALAGADSEVSALGSFKSTYEYEAGVALRFEPKWRVRLAYRGETWVLDRTNRVFHGIELGLVALLL